MRLLKIFTEKEYNQLLTTPFLIERIVSDAESTSEEVVQETFGSAMAAAPESSDNPLFRQIATELVTKKPGLMSNIMWELVTEKDQHIVKLEAIKHIVVEKLSEVEATDFKHYLIEFALHLYKPGADYTEILRNKQSVIDIKPIAVALDVRF